MKHLDKVGDVSTKTFCHLIIGKINECRHKDEVELKALEVAQRQKP